MLTFLDILLFYVGYIRGFSTYYELDNTFIPTLEPLVQRPRHPHLYEVLCHSLLKNEAATHCLMKQSRLGGIHFEQVSGCSHIPRL